MRRKYNVLSLHVEIVTHINLFDKKFFRAVLIRFLLPPYLNRTIFADVRPPRIYTSKCINFLPLVRRLRSTRCHRGGRVLCSERELLLSLEHLPAEDPVSEAIDFVLLLVAEAARGLHKNGEAFALFLYTLTVPPYIQTTGILLAKHYPIYDAGRRSLGGRIKNSLHGLVVVSWNLGKKKHIEKK